MSGAGKMFKDIKEAVENHNPEGNSSAQWYVDEHVIDCDANEFWMVVESVLRGVPLK